MSESNGDCSAKDTLSFKDVPVETFESFSSREENLTPVVIRGYDIGPCKNHWNADYLKTKLSHKIVTVHKSQSSILQFLPKNFSYENMAFGEFLDAIDDCGISPPFCYLRSLADSPRDKVADFQNDFPEISSDVNFPSLCNEDSFFSSVFRISSPSVELWTHFDTMDNFLIQIKGEKRIIFFPPSDALNLYMIEDKSKVCDLDHVDLHKFPKLRKCHAWKCILKPGDVVFIPAFWFHNVKAIDFSIAVNVFWKSLSNEIYDPKDVYGNYPLVPGRRATQSLDSTLKKLDPLPAHIRDFYIRCFISKLSQSLSSGGPENH